MSNRDHIEMVLKSIEAFQESGNIESEKLTEIIQIAEKDGVIDQNEIRVLRNIIAKVDPTDVDDDLKGVLQSLSTKISDLKS